MNVRQLFYFILLGCLFGLFVISVEVIAIARTRFEWERNPALEVFLSGAPWYILAHLLLSVLIGSVLLFGFDSKLFGGSHKRTLDFRLWVVWGLYTLLFFDLFVAYGVVLGQRLSLHSSIVSWIAGGVMFLGILLLITLVPCVLLSLVLRSRRRLQFGLLLVLLGCMSFAAIAWLQQQEVVVTKQQISLATRIFSSSTVVLLTEGFSLGVLALILTIAIQRLVNNLGSKDLRANAMQPLLFLIILITFAWVWILTSRPAKSTVYYNNGIHRNYPNVIEVVIDTFGGKYLSPDRLTQYPAFVELAKDGFHFVNAYSTATCTGWSVPAILTSNFNFVNSDRRFKEFGWLEQEEITTAEILKGAGYETLGLSANTVVSETFGYDQGFDYFKGPGGNILLGTNLLKTFGAIRTKFAYQYGLVDSGSYYKDISYLYSEMENYISQRHSRPFYLFVQTMDMHGPYMPPKEYLDTDFAFEDFRSHWYLVGRRAKGNIEEIPDKTRENTLTLYLAELRYTDDYMGRLINLLKELDIYDKTLIIVTADHGEAFWEHENYGHCLNEPYNELINVPLFVKPPESLDNNQFRRGLIVNENVSTLDILPTILDFIRLDRVSFDTRIIMGQSLLPLMLGKADEIEDNRIVFGVERNLRFVINRHWKLVWEGETGNFKLYNLEQDPLERENIFSSHHSSVQSLLSELTNFSKNFGREKNYEKGTGRLDPKLEQELRSLGYVQ